MNDVRIGEYFAALTLKKRSHALQFLLLLLFSLKRKKTLEFQSNEKEIDSIANAIKIHNSATSYRLVNKVEPFDQSETSYETFSLHSVYLHKSKHLILY